MKTAAIIARVSLGLLFVLIGLDEILAFIPPPPVHGVGEQFMIAMAVKTHYMYGVAAFEIVGGLLLLTRRYAPLGLTLVGPVIVNVILFHIFMDHTGSLPGVAVSVLATFVLWCYRENFAGLIRA